MLRERLASLARDEQGMTLVELLVATAAGIVVFGVITTALLATMRDVRRVSSHVEANQRARLTLSKIVNELHSGCVTYLYAPVQKESTGTVLTFVHGEGSAPSVTPTESKITLGTNGVLTQSEYPVTGGKPSEWTFAEQASSTVQLISGISPLTSGGPVFTYYGYTSGKIASAPFPTPLSKENAERTVQVNIAFKAAPTQAQTGDAGAETAVQDSAYLRLTPAGFETGALNQPCQ
jgi:hypothetical protein